MAQCNVCSFVFVVYLFAAAMTECKAYSFSGFEEYDLHTLYKKYGEVWVSLILNTPICNIPGAPQLPKEIKIGHIKYLLDHVPEILPSSLHLEYHDLSQLEDGDVLVIHSLWMWKTYAIVSSAKERKVICFATRDQRPVSDMEALFTREDVRLQEVSFAEVLDRDHGVVEVIRQENHKKALQNARTALAGEHPWSLFGFNSEHFVTHVITGRAQSPQLDSLLCVHKKALLSGIMAGLVTPESCTILRKYAQCVAIITTNNVVSSSKVTSSQIAKETMKKVTNKVIISSTRGAASHVAKQTAKKTARKVVSGSTRAGVSHVTKETAKKTAKKVVSSSTKTAASHMAKETAKKATRKVVSSSTKAGATHVAKETTKKAAKKVVSSSTKNVASHMAKQTAKKTAKKVVSSSTKTAASHAAKETAKKATKKFVSRSTQAAASHVAKETAKKTARKAVSSSTKATASHMAKQTAKKTAKKVIGGSTKAAASQVTKQTAKEATEEVAGATATTATSRLASGAKAGLIVGAAVEGACLAYTGYTSYEMMKKGEISSTEFRQHMVKRSAAAGGSLAGGAIGAAIGTAIIPVPFLGTFVGGVVGGVVGDLVGSKCGEEFDKYAFNQNEAAV